eukprot:621731-Hanusia_phi.AAC.5
MVQHRGASNAWRSPAEDARVADPVGLQADSPRQVGHRPRVYVAEVSAGDGDPEAGARGSVARMIGLDHGSLVREPAFQRRRARLEVHGDREVPAHAPRHHAGGRGGGEPHAALARGVADEN